MARESIYMRKLVDMLFSICRVNGGKAMGITINQNITYAVNYATNLKKATEKSDYAYPKTLSKENSIVDEYCARKPENASVMRKWMKAGQEVQTAFGLNEVDRSEMSMAEYKNMITESIAGIPFHMTRPYDEETVIISDEGWEAMKEDPEYEAWVLGYIKTNRDVKNPFFGMGDMGSYSVETFGARIEDRKGYGYSKIYGGTAAGARSMFQSASAGGSITTRAPQADAQPPKDYNLWEERAKEKRAKQKKQQHEEMLEELLQSRINYRSRMNELLTQKYYAQVDYQKQLNSDFLQGQDVNKIQSPLKTNSLMGNMENIISNYEIGTFDMSDNNF